MMRQDRFTEQAQQVLANSQEIVRQKRNSQWGVAHVLAALVTLNGGLAEQVLQKLNVDMNRLRQRVGKQVADLPTLAYDVVQIYTTPEVVRMLEVANSEASTSASNTCSSPSPTTRRAGLPGCSPSSG